MNVIFLPTWANAAFIVAIIVLIVSALSKNIKVRAINFATSKKAYYITATIIAAAMAAVFLILAPMRELYVSYLVLVGIVLFIAMLVSVLGTMDEAVSEKKRIWAITVAVTTVVIVFLTLIYGSAALAAIWLGTLIALAFIGYQLFPSSK